MDVFNKFIIVSNEDEPMCMYLGRVTYHKQLAHESDTVISGGWWRHDENDNITFYGDSHEFGKFKEEDVEYCVKNKKIFTSWLLDHEISEDFNKFFIDRRYEIIEIESY